MKLKISKPKLQIDFIAIKYNADNFNSQIRSSI